MDLKHLRFKKEDILFSILLILVLILQIYKAHLGMGSRDEHFYVTLGYRFYQGDALFSDDWHIAQMIGFFIMPLVALYRSIIGSNEGIILGFRYFYILFTCFIGIGIYLKFRKEYTYFAIGSGFCYMLFTPFQIMALSYNTMSVGFLLLALLVYKRHSNLRLYLAGFLYGCAVINTPYLALGYLFIIYMFIKHKDVLNLKEFLLVTLGITTIAITFLTFVFSRETLTTVLSNLKYLVDPSHSTSIPVLFATNGYRLIRQLHLSFILLIFEIIYAFLFRKQYKEKKVLEISYIITILSLIYVGIIHQVDISIGGYVGILVPIYILGFVLLLIEKRNSYLVFCYGVSTFHAFLLSISSNVGPRSFLGPLIVACMITVLLLKDYKDNFSKVSIGVFVLLLLFFKATNVYGGSNDYSTKFTSGPLKGLYDMQESVESYNKTLSDMNYINTLDSDYISSITYNSWTYLATEKKCGTNSTYIYFWYEDQYETAFDLYHSLHKDKDAIIYLDNSAPFNISEDSEWMSQFTKVEELENGVLYKY